MWIDWGENYNDAISLSRDYLNMSGKSLSEKINYGNFLFSSSFQFWKFLFFVCASCGGQWTFFKIKEFVFRFR